MLDAGARFSGSKTWRGAHGDCRHAFDMLDYMSSGPKETEAYTRWIFERAQAFVGSVVHWPQIEAVARELLAKRKGQRRRSSKEVREICRLALCSSSMASQAALTGAFFFPVALEGSGRGLASAPWPVWGGADIRPRRLNGAGAQNRTFAGLNIDSIRVARAADCWKELLS